MTTTRRAERPAEQAPATVREAVLAVMDELGEQGIGKSGWNSHSKYKYRAIEDVLAAFNRAQVKHGLTIEHELVRYETERVGKNQYVTVTMKYTFTGPDNSTMTQVYGGCAGDVGDKAMSKAQTNAYKYMLITVFNVPLDGMSDGDDSTPDRAEAEQQAQREQVAEQRARSQARDRLLATGARKGLDADGVIAWCLQQYNGHPKDANVGQLVEAERELAKLPDKPKAGQNCGEQQATRPQGGERHPAGKRRLPQQRGTREKANGPQRPDTPGRRDADPQA